MAKQLEKIQDSKAMYSMLKNTKILREPMILWRFVGDRKVTAKVDLVLVRKYRNEIIVKPRVDYMNEYKQIVSVAERVNFFIPYYSLLFQCNLKEVESNLCSVFDSPCEYAQVDRREHIRIPLGDENKVGVLVAKTKISQDLRTNLVKPCFDISGGGFSILVSKMETRFFSKGRTFDKIYLKIFDKPFKVKAKVVNNISVDPTNHEVFYASYKVSFQFVDISKSGLKDISRLLQNSGKIEMVL
jgi:hypothetical protein